MTQHLISIEDTNDSLFATATWLAEEIRSADGHSSALARIVPVYISRGQVDLAAELSDSIADPFTRDRLLASIAEKCASSDDVDYAFQLADAIEDHGIASEARERIGMQQAAAGDVEAAVETAAGLDHPDNVFSRLALYFDSKGDSDKCDEMLGRIEFPTARSAALTAVAATAIAADDKTKAVMFLDRAVESAVEIDYETDEIRILTDLGNLFVDAGRKDRAIETLDKARQIAESLDSVHREYLLSAISLGFFNAGSIDLADRVLDLISDKTHMAATLLGFARGFWNREEKEDALDALDEAYQILKSQHQSETRDSKSKFQLWRSIAAQFAGFDKHELGLEAADALPDEDESAEARSEIAQIASLQNEQDFAEQAFSGISDDAKRLGTLVGMSDANRRAGRDELGLKQLNEAAGLIETVPQFAVRSAVLNDLAQRFADIGDKDRARGLIVENLSTIGGIRDESVRAIALADLAELHESLGFDLTDEERQKAAEWVRRAQQF